MKEESKEEYLARHRKQLAANKNSDDFLAEIECDPDRPLSFMDKLKKWTLLLLFAAFILAIYQIFGMLNSN